MPCGLFTNLNNCHMAKIAKVPNDCTSPGPSATCTARKWARISACIIVIPLFLGLKNTISVTDWKTTIYNSVAPPGVNPLEVTGPDTENVPVKSRLVLMTALFGDRPLPPYFPIFLRSIQGSGVDGIVIGGNEMDLKDILPPNVRHISITWDGLHALISNKLFDGTPLKGFLGASAYKVIDVKPLFGFLFQEYIRDYEFWAHVDNDMIFGNVAGLMNPFMDRFDVISHLSKWKHKTYGPFTAYRNIPKFTELFQLIEADLYETLNTPEFYSIDEWGHFPHDELNQFTDANYPRSMSNVIEKY
jgi:hypothetical protein